MDLNAPGLSLFQGSTMTGFDNNAQREEEEEAIEDQKRREIELKNILENAFDDVSFENEECSGVNLIGDTHSNCQINSVNSSKEDLKNNSLTSLPDFGKPYSDDNAENCNTPVCHSRSVRTKTLDFNSPFEPDSYSEQYRIKQKNGSLQDLVDASGGGAGDATLYYNSCLRSNSLDYKTNEEPVSTIIDGNIVLNQHYQNADFNSVEQLQILYDVRVREVHRLTELIDTMRSKFEYENNELKKQLAISNAENERHKISYADLQNLLVASKEEADNFGKEIELLKKKIHELEESREELITELNTSRALVNDLERKLLAIEKGRKEKTAAMQYEAIIQELKEKHSVELQNILKNYDSCKLNLESKIQENSELKFKLNQLSQVNDENLAKKSEIIHRLSKQIEETQEQCEKLMRNALSEDNVKLQMEIKVMKDENSSLRSKIEHLENSLGAHEAELKQYECLSNISAFDSKLSSGSGIEKEHDYSEINRKLREELFRALNSQKARRQEIQSLQCLIKKKDEQICCMAEKERMFLADAAKFRDDIGKHMSELKKYEQLTEVREKESKKLQDLLKTTKEELELELKAANKKCSEIEQENMHLQDELKILRDNLEKEKLEAVSKYNEEYLKFHNDGLRKMREEAEESHKLELIGKDLEIENCRKELEEVKNLYVDVYNEKQNLLNQIEKGKAASSRSTVDVDEVKRLQKELEKSRGRILDLDLTLRQQYQQEVEKLNGHIKTLELEVEKLKKERDHEVTERDRIVTENELLKGEVEQLTSEKNLNFLNCEILQKEIDQLKRNVHILEINSEGKTSKTVEEHHKEMQDLRAKYEIKIQKLNKEIELMLTKVVTTESKYTSPMKPLRISVATQRSPVSMQSISTSPLRQRTEESCTSPIHDLKFYGKAPKRDMSMVTDPEPKDLSKREVIRMMEKLGAEHEEEMNLLDNKYKMELIKLDRRWQLEVETITKELRAEMMNAHAVELQALQEKHRTEMENRIEQEKKEAVVALITEWACEVQNLKQSHAEAQAEAEKMRAKYKTLKNISLRHKAYFNEKVERMRDEWNKMEQAYEKTLRDLQKNVHMLVDVREDEVKAKVESITKLYEMKINKMKKKLEKYETLIQNEKGSESVGKASSKNSVTDDKNSNNSGVKTSPEKLTTPTSFLFEKNKNDQGTEGKKLESPSGHSRPLRKETKSSKDSNLKKLLNEAYFFEQSLTDEDDDVVRARNRKR